MRTSWRRRNIHLPVTLSVLLISLNIVLMVCWIVLLAQNDYWSALAIGTVTFALILVGLVVYLVLMLKEISLNRRQVNFVDSVTHELKSPIAALRLYLETLLLRNVDENQRDQFCRFMMSDVARLDRLINHLLEVGRLDAIVTADQLEDVALEPLLQQCASAACAQHDQPVETVRLRTVPAVVHGCTMALEMVFRNLLENAVKYAGAPPAVEVDVEVRGNRKVVTRIADNGAGVAPDIRNKIFQLFFRGGNELERTKKGAGLGLYIVQTLVRRMKGRVTVYSRNDSSGAVFEVELPGRAAPCAS